MVRKAGEQGDAWAQYNLGGMYDDGKGVTQDMIAANMWFNIAMKNRNKEATNHRDIVAKKLSAEQLEKAEK